VFLEVKQPQHLNGTMSWDGYLDNIIQRTKTSAGDFNSDKACIIGLNGAKWTSDALANALKVSQDEAMRVGAAFSKKDFSSFQAQGIVLEGNKYQFLRVEDDKVVLGKKKDFGSVTLQSTKQAIIIAHTPEGKQQGSSNMAVGAIADYLESIGY